MKKDSYFVELKNIGIGVYIPKNEEAEDVLCNYSEGMRNTNDFLIDDELAVVIAAAKGFNALLAKIISYNLVDPYKEENYGRALFLATENSNLEGVKIILSNELVFSNSTIKSCAAYCVSHHEMLDDALEIFKLLISYSIDVNDQYLLQLVSVNGLYDFAKVLFDNGQVVRNDYYYPRYEMPLKLAAECKNNLPLVKLLVENGADVSEANYAAVKNAFAHYNRDVAEYLLGLCELSNKEYFCIKQFASMQPCFTALDNDIFVRYEEKVGMK